MRDPARELSADDRRQIIDAGLEVHSAMLSVLLASDAGFASTAASSLRRARAELRRALQSIDAIEAQFSPPPPIAEALRGAVEAEANSSIGITVGEAAAPAPVRLVPRFDPAPAASNGGEAS